MPADSSQKPKNKLLGAVQASVSILSRDRAPEALEAISSVEDARVRDALLRNRQYGDLPLDVIDADPDQVRKVETKGEPFDELVSSVRMYGVIQPISVRFQQETGRFQIIAGERRYQAAKRAGLKTIPAVLKDIDDTKKAIHQLVENLQRQNLNPIEEARAFNRYLAATGKSHEQLSREIGKDRSYVTKTLTILEKLTRPEQELVAQCAPAHMPGRSLIFEALRFEDPKTRRAILTGELSRQEAREKVQERTPRPSDGRRKLTMRRIQVEKPPATVTVTLPDPKASDDDVRRALQAALKLVERG